MIEAFRAFIRRVDALNRRLGRVIMYGIFALMAVLLWSSVSKTFFLPSLWTLEMAQFIMVAYYILGGPYSIQLGSNVRMDLFYGDWSPRKKAWFDLITVLFLIFYLGGADLWRHCLDSLFAWVLRVGTVFVLCRLARRGRRDRSHGALVISMAPLSMANQVRNDRRYGPDAAAMCL